MNLEGRSLIMIREEDLSEIKATQHEILKAINNLAPKKNGSDILIKNITAIEFMKAVRMSRSKFDELVRTNKIKAIKKKRKIYVPVSEIDRYFSDQSIQ